MSDRQLRKQLIRLAHRRPELRDDLLPLLSRTAAKASPEVEAFFEGMLEKVHSTDHPNRVKRSGDSIYAEFGDAAITVMHNRRMDTVCTDIEGRTYCNPVEAANALEDLMRDQRENRPMRSAARKTAAYDDAKLRKVCDAFTRFLIGDPKAAVRHLSSVGNPDVMGVGDMEADEMNRTWDDLYSALYQAAKRNLPDW